MIDNTEQSMTNPDNALVFLAASMGRGGVGGAIIELEATGQRQLVHSNQLPTAVHGDRAEFEALGFGFGEPADSDPLFAPATLPESWTRQASDHAMWSYVVDALGRRRVSVFYKAAFYDRDAYMTLIDVGSYLRRCVADRRDVVADDTWATPRALATAAREEQQTAERYIARWTTRRAHEAVARCVADRDAYAAIAAHFEGK
ncbi:hypothetical protein [Streptomyces sp. NPDC091212]|uniref:hypothetical protein n=1 Tax=Streptomyces sp. NPDC091212 TaxID=3155191 RepID=UPI0034382D02